MSIRRFTSMLFKEYRHILHEPRTLWMVFLSPAFVLIALSTIFTGGSNRIDLALWDQDHTPLSRQFAATLSSDDDFSVGYTSDYEEIETLLVERSIDAALIIAAQGFTRERELGTLEQLRVTTLGRLELMAGKAIPTLLVGLMDCLLMTGVIVAWFDIPMRGSLPLLLLLTIPFVLVQIGWGTLISLISRTQQQAMLFVFALAMLEVALSGFMVPAGDMPGAMRVLSTISSVQHYMVIARGVMLRGAGWGSLWLPALALSGIAFAVTSLAWLRLRLGLDTDSLRQRLQILWHVYQRRQRERRAGRGVKRVRRSEVKKPRPTREPVYVDVYIEE